MASRRVRRRRAGARLLRKRSGTGRLVAKAESAEGDEFICRSSRHLDQAIAQADRPRRMMRYAGIVCDQDDRFALAMRSSKILRISTPEAESRFPVGSSARMMRGSFTRARAMATRCCWPRIAHKACGRGGRRGPRALPRLSPNCGSPPPASLVIGGTSIFSTTVNCWIRVVGLKD